MRTMKQYITQGQLDKLSEKGRERLEEWWWKKVDEWSLPKQVRCPEVEKPYWSDPFLSIGQMVEFLDERGKIKVVGGGLLVGADDTTVINSGRYLEWVGELCDALWQAIKEELEK